MPIALDNTALMLHFHVNHQTNVTEVGLTSPINSILNPTDETSFWLEKYMKIISFVIAKIHQAH